MIDPGHLKPLVWIGTSRRELSAMPQAVRSELGYALYVAQLVGTYRKAKLLKGFGGAWVMEIVSDHRGDSYRCVYTVRFAGSFTYCTRFRRSRRGGARHPRPRLRLSSSDLAKQNALREG